MKKRDVRINAVLNVVKQCCNILFPLITYTYVSRVLGSSNLGRYSFADSIISYFLLFASLGIPTYAIREGARIRDKQKVIFDFASEMFSINMISAIVSYVFLVFVIFAIPRLQQEKVILLILSINIFLGTLGRDWINTIYEDFFFITIRYLVFQTISAILIVLLVHDKDDLLKYAAYGESMSNHPIGRAIVEKYGQFIYS